MKINVPRVIQKKGHCGPASLEMFYAFYGLNISQDNIVSAARVSQFVERKGTRLDQLSEAISLLTPDYVLIGKKDASLLDIKLLNILFCLPVGVEWQGVFISETGKIFEEGHYSLIIDCNEEYLQIMDPDERSALKNGLVPTNDFLIRWWDINEFPCSNLESSIEILDKNLLFLLIKKENLTELIELGFQIINTAFFKQEIISDKNAI